MEIERKYEVPEGAKLPVPSGFRADPPETFDLAAVYWDTEDAALARAAIAFRRREGGHDAGWHLKLPARLGREEVTAPLTDAPPAELLARIAAVTGGRPLSELAVLATVRTIRTLYDAAGNAVVELADDTVTATDARSGTVRRWREWEAELLPAAASPALLDEVEIALLAVGATPSGSLSKLARALGRDALG